MRVLALALLLPGAALADGAVAVPLPDLAGLSEAQSQELLRAVVSANVVGMNCPEFQITDGEWSLLTGSADALAYANLNLSTDAYDADYYGPAFASLDDAATCGAEGPRIRGLIHLLQDMGGSVEAIPDTQLDGPKG